MCVEYNECHYCGMYNVYVKEFLLLHKLCICVRRQGQVSALRKKRLKSPSHEV